MLGSSLSYFSLRFCGQTYLDGRVEQYGLLAAMSHRPRILAEAIDEARRPSW